jgi:hypothetical protein
MHDQHALTLGWSVKRLLQVPELIRNLCMQYAIALRMLIAFE